MKQNNKKPIIIGKTQTSLIKEVQKLLSIDYGKLKASHGCIF
jgi:hypothetical protein